MDPGAQKQLDELQRTVMRQLLKLLGRLDEVLDDDSKRRRFCQLPLAVLEVRRSCSAGTARRRGRARCWVLCQRLRRATWAAPTSVMPTLPPAHNNGVSAPPLWSCRGSLRRSTCW